MRILHVTPSFAPAWSYGGLPRVAAGLCRELSRRGHQLEVVTTDVLAEGRRRDASDDAAALESCGLESLHVLRNLSDGAAYHQQAYFPLGPWDPVVDALARADVVHVHGHRNLLELGVVGLAVRQRRPLLFTPNGTAVNIEQRRWLKGLGDLFGFRRALSLASLVSAVSPSELADLQRLGIPAERLRLVPNAIDPEGFDVSALRGRLRDRLGLGAQPIVLYLGKITPRKGVDTLVRAVAQMTERPLLVIAGNTMGSGRRILAVAKSRGVRVIELGLVDDAGRREALADADVVAYAGWGEAFGLSAAEAIAAQRPVVAASDHGCGEWVEVSGGGWVVPPRDPTALAQALSQALRDPSRAAQGRDFVRRELSWSRVVQRYERLYEELAGTGQSPAITAPAQTRVSLVIPTRNGMATLPALFDALAAQQQRRVRLSEIIVVDSRSDDGTCAWLAARDDVRLLHVDPQDFGHGRTRNRAAAEARGELIVFLSQDAVPASDEWLERLCAPLLENAQTVGSWSRQVPNTGHDPLSRSKVRHWLSASLEPRVAGAEALAAAATPVEQREQIPFDNVSSCVRAEWFYAQPFADVPFAEDLDWALRAVRAGKLLRYAPDSVVRHSHRSALRPAFERARLDHRQQRRLFGADVLAQHHGGGPAAPLRHWLHLSLTYARWVKGEAPPGLTRRMWQLYAVAVAAAETLGVAAARRGPVDAS